MVKRKSTSSTRSLRPKKKWRNAVTRVPRSNFMSLNDPGVVVTLKYVSILSKTAAASTTAGVNIYRLNSLYDPDYTGTGAQPYGFDQLAAMYAKYQVLSATAVNEWGVGQLGTFTGDRVPLVVGCTNTTIPGLTLNNETLAELPESSTAMAPCIGGQSVKTFTKFSPQYNLGLKDDTTIASVGTNPSQVSYINLWVSNTGTAAQPYVVTTTITYRVRFFQATPNGGS